LVLGVGSSDLLWASKIGFEGSLGRSKFRDLVRWTDKGVRSETSGREISRACSHGSVAVHRWALVTVLGAEKT